MLLILFLLFLLCLPQLTYVLLDIVIQELFPELNKVNTYSFLFTHPSIGSYPPQNGE